MIPGLILVRTSSTRLPMKCFLPFGNGKVIEHIARRAEHFGFRPIICTTDSHKDDDLCNLVLNNGWNAFRGSEKDKIKRLRDACNHFEIDKFVTIDADDPFFDAALNKAIYKDLESYDFVEPPSDYYCGSAGFGVKTNILDKTIDKFDTSKSEMMWKLVERLPDIKIKIKEKPMNMPKMRLTLDYEEDYHLLLFVLRVLGQNAKARQIKELFENNSDLYKMNWFREAQWKERQDEIIIY